MKIILISLIFILNFTIYAAFPVMLKITTTEKITKSVELSFRSGVEESLTKNGYTLNRRKNSRGSFKGASKST